MRGLSILLPAGHVFLSHLYNIWSALCMILPKELRRPGELEFLLQDLQNKLTGSLICITQTEPILLITMQMAALLRGGTDPKVAPFAVGCFQVY